jgi:dolichyl-phosphate-mannose--protein O-mannosyl transferase
MVFSMIIYFIVAYLPFYAFERYFYPAVPFLIIFSAYSLVTIISKIYNNKHIKKTKELS